MNKLFYILLFVLLLFSFSCSDLDEGSRREGDDFKIPDIYHDPHEIEVFLLTTSYAYPAITHLETVGTSVSGRKIYSLIISDNPETREADEPGVRLTGSIHGNEYISGEILIRYIEYLTQNYNMSPSVTEIVNNRYIAIIPTLNPDGLGASTRYNANGVDLNRNFSVEWISGGSHGVSPFSEIESASFRDYSLSKVFHLSATFHSGAEIVNMPFDYGEEHGDPPVFPDENDLVRYMAKIYSASGSFLLTPNLMAGIYVDTGTINGGDWYIANGTLQDWSYLEAGCLDITVEVAVNSPLDTEGIEEYFVYNKDSITAYINAAGTGVYGSIKDNSNNPVVGASVQADGGDLVTYSDSRGYYYKILKPGSYTLNVSKDGYTPFTGAVTVSAINDATPLNVTLNP